MDPLIQAGTTLLAVIVGWLGAHWTQVRSDELRVRRDTARRLWESRRDAYFALMASADALYAGLSGVLLTGEGEVPHEVQYGFVAAFSRADLLASSQAAPRVAELQEALAAMGNNLHAVRAGNQQAAADSAERVVALGLDNPGGWKELRDRTRRALLSDLKSSS